MTCLSLLCTTSKKQKHSNPHEHWLGHHQRGHTARVTKHLKRFGQHACMLLCVNYSFKSRTYIFCTKLRVYVCVCVNIRVTEMFIGHQQGNIGTGELSTKSNISRGKKTKTCKDTQKKHTPIYPTIHPSSIHRNTLYKTQLQQKNPSVNMELMCTVTERGSGKHEKLQ